MTWKSTVIVSGAGVVATWLTVVSTPGAPQTVAPSAAASVPAPMVTDIEREAMHLQSAVRTHTDYRTPSRNPFRFAEHAARRTSPPSRALESVAPVAAPQPQRPSIRLSGIASDTVDGAVQRTAVLSTGSDVLLLREGESGGGYTVSKIADEAVELVDAGGGVVILTLTNP